MTPSDLLLHVSLFADLRDDALVALAGRLGRRVFAKDTILFDKGSPAQILYVLDSGAVRIFVPWPTGDEITLDIYGPYECFGEEGLLEGSAHCTSAMALQRSVVYSMQRDDFLACLESHPQVVRRLCSLLDRRLRHVTVFAENLAFLDVAGRVATVLLELAARQSGEHGTGKIDLGLTQSDIATWVSASREMVNKVLRGYQMEGLITMQGHTIWIIDPDRLRRETSA